MTRQGRSNYISLETTGAYLAGVDNTADSDYTIDEFDYIVTADTNNSALTITLASSEAEEGRFIIVKDVGGNALNNNITISTEGSEKIDGSTSDITISSNYGKYYLFVYNGNWFILN